MTGFYRSAEGARAVEARYRAILARWPVPNQQLRVATREGETFVVACGEAGAPALLLLHGSASNSAMWMGDVAAWARHFRVYAVDLIGEPGLSAASRPALASEAHALWLGDVLESLALERVSMVGISLGGWLALDLATRRPEQVESLALLCPGGVGRQRKEFLFEALPLLLLGEWGRRKLMALVAGPAATAAPPPPEFRDFMALIYRHFRARRESLPVFSDEALQRLRMPVLAILGARDAMLDSADTRRRLERNVPHAGIAYLPDAGHVLIHQTDRILDFLRRARGR